MENTTDNNTALLVQQIVHITSILYTYEHSQVTDKAIEKYGVIFNRAVDYFEKEKGMDRNKAIACSQKVFAQVRYNLTRKIWQKGLLKGFSRSNKQVSFMDLVLHMDRNIIESAIECFDEKQKDKGYLLDFLLGDKDFFWVKGINKQMLQAVV